VRGPVGHLRGVSSGRGRLRPCACSAAGCGTGVRLEYSIVGEGGVGQCRGHDQLDARTLRSPGRPLRL